MLFYSTMQLERNNKVGLQPIFSMRVVCVCGQEFFLTISSKVLSALQREEIECHTDS